MLQAQHAAGEHLCQPAALPAVTPGGQGSVATCQHKREARVCKSRNFHVSQHIISLGMFCNHLKI